MAQTYTLASLPTPLDKEKGCTSTSPVYGLKGMRKRKRHEVVLAVDGEGINTYNVQSQALVTSYALSPQTYVCSKPCAIFCRATPTSPAQRRTYAAIRNGAGSTARKIVCFTESVRGRSSREVDFSAPKRVECNLADGEICGLDIAAFPQTELLYLVVSYRDGRLITVLGDLSKTMEVRPSTARQVIRDDVEYSIVIDAETARKGMLKGREDVLAALEQVNSGSHLLCQIVRSNSGRRLDLCLLQSHARNEIQAMQPKTQRVMSFDLPMSSESASLQAEHELHAPSSRLYSLADGKLTIYDLGSTVPKILTKLGSKVMPISSFSRLSASTLVAINGDEATVFETSYGSPQLTASLQPSASSSKQPKKRKRDSNDLDGTRVIHKAISAFSDLGILALLSDDELVGVQLGEDMMGQERTRSRFSRLADVIGHGRETHRQAAPIDGRRAGTLAGWTDTIDELIESNNIEGLEMLVANDETLGRQRKPEKFRARDSLDVDGVDGDVAAYDDLWPLPETLDPTRLDEQRVLYILSRIFSYVPNEAVIEVRILSRKLLEWLALAGFLNSALLEQALRPGDTGAQREAIRPGDVMVAISEVDEDFQLMHSLLSLPVRWELAEIIQTLCLLIRSFNSAPATLRHKDRTLQLLMPSQSRENGDLRNDDVEMINGDADSHVDSESRAAENELEHVERVLDSGLEVRSATIRIAFDRLHAYPAHDVTNAMRMMMMRSDLIFLVHLLRIELADGGWTSRYIGVETGDQTCESPTDPLLASMVDHLPSDGELGPSNQAIHTIGDLLNCAVDAVGTGGWLVGQSGDALETEELLKSLLAEVSAGLEGCYEATALGNILTELERFTASGGHAVHQNMHGEGLDLALPIGGKAEPTTTLKSRGFDAKKSKHVLAMEKSRRVGKYSLERIRF